MAAKTKLDNSLAKLLGASSRPIYVVDARRQIVFCNPALANWLGMQPERIVGREVEYHSEPGHDDPSATDEGPLAALCPPPRAMSGEPCGGTVSCVARDGRLVHRQAEFIPLQAAGGGLLVLLADADMSPNELTTEITGEPTADQLHRAIRMFRREQATRYGVPSLLGNDSAIERVRAQAAAAAASGANVLLVGRPGSGRAHVARLIHYQATADANAKLVPVDCGTLTDDLLRRIVDSLHDAPGDARRRPTLLLENLQRLSHFHQSQLVEAIRKRLIVARLIATLDSAPARANPAEREAEEADGHVQPTLLDAVSTITIRLPRLVERLGDLPILVQSFVEAQNQGQAKQIGAVRPDALDLLALYDWPGELDELGDVIAAAHRAATTHEITPRDLPAVIQHAARAAALPRRQPERIVLDQLLGAIEREVIERALAQAGGNKTEAAALLGMTRPRLYRRLVQLGLAGGTAGEAELDAPEFVEQENRENEL